MVPDGDSAKDTAHSAPSSKNTQQDSVAFPTAEEHQEPDAPMSERPGFNRHLSLGPSSSPTKDRSQNSRPLLSRSVTDRRISLPALGIDLGRSGPSYGHTLKRSTVSVYGLARGVFDCDTRELAADDIHVPDSERSSDLNDATSASRVSSHHPSHWIGSCQTATEEPISEDLATIHPFSISTSNSRSQSRFTISSNHWEQHQHPSGHPQPTRGKSNSSFRPPSLARSQTVAGFNPASVRNARLAGPDLSYNMRFLSSRRESLHRDSLGLFRPDEGVINDPRDSQETDQPIRGPRAKKETLSEGSRRVRKKRQIVKELVETERRYVAVLEKIDQNYLQPIQRSQRKEENTSSPRNSRYSGAFTRAPNGRPLSAITSSNSVTNLSQKEILSVATTADIFSNFTPILSLAREFLSVLEQMGAKSHLFDTDFERQDEEVQDENSRLDTIAERDARILATNEELMVGRSLSSLWPFFKLYTVFTTNFAVSQSRLHLHSTKPSPSPEFVKLLADCRKRGIDNGLGLPDMLLSIIQRVPRYELLFKDLLKYSSEQCDPDHPFLLSSQRMLSYVARRMEAAMQDQEERTKILCIQRAMEGLTFPLVNPTRKLVKIGLLRKLDRKGDRPKRIFFLFNDCLIYAGLLSYHSQEALEAWITWLGVKPILSPSTNPHPYMNSSQSVNKNMSSLLSSFGYSEDSEARLIFCRKMDLNSLTVVGTAIRLGGDGEAFQIISPTKSFVVYAGKPDTYGLSFSLSLCTLIKLVIQMSFLRRNVQG